MFKENFLVFLDKKAAETVQPEKTEGKADPLEVNQMVSEEDYFSPEKMAYQDKVRAELEERSKRTSELLVESSVDVFTRAVDLLKVTGVTAAEAERLLSGEDDNPYSVWLMDFLDGMPGNGWAIDLNESGKRKHMMFKSKDGVSRSFRMADRIFQWEKFIYPELLKMLERWVGSLEYKDIEGVFQRAISNPSGYPAVETWIGLVSGMGFGISERVKLAAVIELLNLKGLDTSWHKEELNKLKDVGFTDPMAEKEPDKSVVEDWDESKDGDVPIYYDNNDEALPVEVVVRIEHRRRKEAEKRLAELKARVKQFGGVAVDVDELDAEVDSFAQDGMEEGDLVKFKDKVKEVLDKAKDKNDIIKKWRSAMDETLVVVEQMAANGKTRDEIQAYVNRMLADLINEANAVEKSGDKELLAEWEELGTIFNALYRAIMEKYDVTWETGGNGQETGGNGQESGGNGQESVSNSGGDDSGEGVPDVEEPPEGAVN